MDGKDFLTEFDMEAENTRRVLERIPDDRLDFRPHERSWTLLQLAGHVANLPSWTSATLGLDELDMAGPFERSEPTTRAAVLEDFERTRAEARSIL